jgi:hypothetical protein
MSLSHQQLFKFAELTFSQLTAFRYSFHTSMTKLAMEQRTSFFIVASLKQKKI